MKMQQIDVRARQFGQADKWTDCDVIASMFVPENVNVEKLVITVVDAICNHHNLEICWNFHNSAKLFPVAPITASGWCIRQEPG